MILMARPNTWSAEILGKSAELVSVDYSPSDRAIRARVGDFTKSEGEAVSVEEASIIVSGGRLDSVVRSPSRCSRILRQWSEASWGHLVRLSMRVGLAILIRSVRPAIGHA